MSHNAPKHRPPGRPRKNEAPRVAYEELDRLLVHGELVECEDRKSTTVTYPTYRDLARRFGCAHSLIAAYSKRNNCLLRREQARARVAAQADQKLVDLRSTAFALSREDELRLVDSCLLRFQQALSEEKVQLGTANDLNLLLRLRAFVQGGADSRQEINGVMTLETIQDRHQRMLRAAREASAEERGELLEPAPVADYCDGDANNADEVDSSMDASYCPGPDDDDSAQFED